MRSGCTYCTASVKYSPFSPKANFLNNLGIFFLPNLTHHLKNSSIFREISFVALAKLVKFWPSEQKFQVRSWSFSTFCLSKSMLESRKYYNTVLDCLMMHSSNWGLKRSFRKRDNAIKVSDDFTGNWTCGWLWKVGQILNQLGREKICPNYSNFSPLAKIHA